MKHLFLAISIVLLSVGHIYGYYEKNYPIRITQPNGVEVQCYITGDEFYRRVHDENNFTIIRDSQTNYLVYAALKDDELISSGYIVGEINPNNVGLTPGIDISPAKKTQIRSEFHKRTPQPKDIPGYNSTKNTKETGFNNGDLNNLVIFIRFSDQNEFSTNPSVYEDMFNKEQEGYSSMYQYFKDVSYDQTHITSTFYPQRTGSTILSYQDTYPRSYFSPKSSYNQNGYDENDYDERVSREHELLKRAVEYVKTEIPSDLDIDFNNDGYIDNICFIVKGDVDGWNDLLWPHKWSLYSENVYINEKRVWTFNFQLEDHLDNSANSVLCHEMFHSLGAPDLYHYSYEGVTPVGPWDLMCNNTNPPQSTSMYMKYKYGGWIDEIPEIKQSGTYTINNVWETTNNCFKIASPNSTGSDAEYFVIEYRDKGIYWDQKLPGSGLIIYRINPKYDGNAGGPPDEIFVFRENGNNPNSEGRINNAYFSSNSGRKTFNDNSNPPCFLTDGTSGGINISNISSTGTTMSFYVALGGFIETSVSSMDFGEVSIEKISEPKTVNVNTYGIYESLEYNITGADKDFFTVTTENWDTSDGGRLNITFAPDEERSYNAVLEISADDEVEPVSIPLTGEGVIIYVKADFTSNRRIAFVGDSISFTDISEGEPNSWSWIFEGASPANSDEQNPIVKYDTPGAYNVTLSVTNTSTNDEKVFDDYIIIEDKNINHICNNSFEYWTDRKPDCWYGSKTTFTRQWVTQVENDAYDANSAIKFNNINSTNFKSFSTQAASVKKGYIYNVSFYVKGEGEIYVGLFDGRNENSGYAPDNEIIQVNSEEWTRYTQSVVADTTSQDAEFIFYIRKTKSDSDHIVLDLVEIIEISCINVPSEEIFDNIFIYPNPATDFITIKFESDLPKEIKIIDVLSKVVYSTKSISNYNKINMSDYPAGTYFIRFEFEDLVKTHKIIVE